MNAVSTTCIFDVFHQNHVWLRSTVLDVADSAVLLHVDVETLRLVILGDHHARLNDAALLGEILLAEVLYRRKLGLRTVSWDGLGRERA